VDALTAAGCDRIFTDHASGKLEHRPALDAMLELLRSGDTVVVWRLDRLGRSVKHLLEMVGVGPLRWPPAARDYAGSTPMHRCRSEACEPTNRPCEPSSWPLWSVPSGAGPCPRCCLWCPVSRPLPSSRHRCRAIVPAQSQPSPLSRHSVPGPPRQPVSGPHSELTPRRGQNRCASGRFAQKGLGGIKATQATKHPVKRISALTGFDCSNLHVVG